MGVCTRNAGAVPLSPLQVSILEFERSWWSEDQPKHEAIADRFAESDDALEHDPLVVRRLRRMRDRRRRERFDEIADGSSS